VKNLEKNMGDRFYTQQKEHKPGRRLKKDVIEILETLLDKKVDGLDRLTIKALDDLTTAISFKITTIKFDKALKELAKK